MFFIESSDREAVNIASNIIRKYEPLYRKLIILPDGSGIIGYGKRIRNIDSDTLTTLTPKVANVILAEDLRNLYIDMPILDLKNVGQKAAILSFAYNIGLPEFVNSKVFRFLVQKKYQLAAEELIKWDKAIVDGRMRVIPALAERRKEEKNLLLS